jgi:hypothetical protein
MGRHDRRQNAAAPLQDLPVARLSRARLRLLSLRWGALAATLRDGAGVAEFLRTAMMETLRGWLPLWLPLIGSVLALHGALRLLPALRP